ncbi:MAG: hypothetical protein IK062_10155 [Selenomonadaceae bacterium]|nr:hypothetical protein [Selenomonadaceae bacterium]
MKDEKILQSEIMSDDELENVTGGAGYIYYMESFDQNGKMFIAVKSNYSLNRKGVEELFANGEKLNPNKMKDSDVGKFQIPANKSASFMEKWQNKGYKFINYNSNALV